MRKTLTSLSLHNIQIKNPNLFLISLKEDWNIENNSNDFSIKITKCILKNHQ